MLRDIIDNFIHPDPWSQEQVRYLARRMIREEDATFWIAAHGRSLKDSLQDQERRHVREEETQKEADMLLRE